MKTGVTAISTYFQNVILPYVFGKIINNPENTKIQETQIGVKGVEGNQNLRFKTADTIGVWFPPH